MTITLRKRNGASFVVVLVFLFLLLLLFPSWSFDVCQRSSSSVGFYNRRCRPKPFCSFLKCEKQQQQLLLRRLSANNDNDISSTLNLLRTSAKLMKELSSQEVDETQAEKELAMEEAEKEERKQTKRKQKEQEQTHPTTTVLSTPSRGETTNNQTTTRNNNSNNKKSHILSNKNNNNNNNTTTSEQDNNNKQKEMGEQWQARLDAFDRRARRTRLILLQKIAGWAFDVCATSNDDTNVSQQQQEPTTTTKPQKKKQKKIDRNSFYAGILLVHLHLAKYVGVAACHPPTRDQIDELFQLADSNRSGTLDVSEFTNAVLVACAPITSRIAIYWSLLAVLPLLVSYSMGGVAEFMRGQVHRFPAPGMYPNILAVLEWCMEHVLSLLFFSILVPNIFGKIDRATRKRARLRLQRRSRPATTTLWWLRLPPTFLPASATTDFAGTTKKKNDTNHNGTEQIQPNSWMRQWFRPWLSSSVKGTNKSSIQTNGTPKPGSWIQSLQQSMAGIVLWGKTENKS